MVMAIRERLFFEEGRHRVLISPVWGSDMVIHPEHLRAKRHSDEPYEITIGLFGLRESMTTKEVVDAMLELDFMPLFDFELLQLVQCHPYLAKGRSVIAMGNHVREARASTAHAVVECRRLRRGIIERSTRYCPLPDTSDWQQVKLWRVRDHLRFAVITP